MSSLLVAAIDIGTTYSGWAFSFRHEFERDPTRVSSKYWTGRQLGSLKAPTCVLIKPDGDTLDSFGYEAETKYAELVLEELHKPWFFFRRFKMTLFDNLKFERSVTLKDDTGKKLPAKTVFSLAIQFLKNDLLEECHKQLPVALKDEDILWVLTVPAIWNDKAKQFMREAAQDACIINSKLLIALEPEVASLYCRHLPASKNKEGLSLASFKPGTKYIVLDAGGGTIDTTVHQVIVDGKLRELHHSSGGAWGGTMVDWAYENFLVSIIGYETFARFKHWHVDDYFDLFQSFEVKKRGVSVTKSIPVILHLPHSLAETVFENTGKTMNEMILLLSSYFREKVSFHSSGRLKVDAELIRSFFNKSVYSIVRHVSSLLETVGNCEAIVMVGGFSESDVLQHAIKNHFSKRLQVIIPDDAGLAVLKGAVIFGHQPCTITERVCRYAYGEETSRDTSARCNHPPTDTEENDGIMFMMLRMSLF